MGEAVALVNRNVARINGTLRAVGHVDGRWPVQNERTASFHLDGILFFLDPTYLRFDLKRFGDRKFLLGSNAALYWFFDGEAEEYFCAYHDDPEVMPADVPIPPNQIPDAFGLASIATEGPHVQRVVDAYQQILALDRDDGGAIVLRKEYWLDRTWPRLIRRVVFRDADGVVQMQSELDDYRSVDGGAVLPYTMTARWPRTGAMLRFRVSRWSVIGKVGADSIQFRAPGACENLRSD